MDELRPLDVQSSFVKALWTQASHKAENRQATPLICPFGHNGRVFQDIKQLLDHARAEHTLEFESLDDKQSHQKLREAVVRMRRADRSPDATLGGTVAPDIAGLSIDPEKEPGTSPSSGTGRKRRAGSDIRAHREKGPSTSDNVAMADPESSREAHTIKSNKPRSKPHDNRLHSTRQSVKGNRSPRRSNIEQSSEGAVSLPKRHPSPGQQSNTSSQPSGHNKQQTYDFRYPGLLLQPESRPISQEQLASEVKSIYAGLTMVETKCIHVDRAQTVAAVPGDNKQFAPDHWQALIALHRTLLHEHHDFFLASQHPSASPALRRLAGKYTMPARMWKHGIHCFLELLRQNLPYSLDYMLTFIYLAYQMMALLYETVPAFEDTWIECLGDLGRYRMAIEDEDIRDRETWAAVARSWYSKAADKNPGVGRLYHHLAILARPNALQQMYYYSRSLTSVEMFSSARESIMTLLGPVLKDDGQTYANPPTIDTNFITTHAHIFMRHITENARTAKVAFLNQLDNHIGRVTAKWKEQGVYTAIANIAAWFDYGEETNTLRLIFELRAKQRKTLPLADHQISSGHVQVQADKPQIMNHEIPSAVQGLSLDKSFHEALQLTNQTFSLVLRRIGDKNVLPHVHVVLSFLSTLAPIEYVTSLIDQAPWADLAPFLNILAKTETQQNSIEDLNVMLTKSIFPVDLKEGNDCDERPLPEDYLVRGLVWGEEYLPLNWFERPHDEEERYLELASTAKRRAERVLRLGYKLACTTRWLLYDEANQTFFAAKP